jgi:hypothetical protein
MRYHLMTAPKSIGVCPVIKAVQAQRFEIRAGLRDKPTLWS